MCRPFWWNTPSLLPLFNGAQIAGSGSQTTPTKCISCMPCTHFRFYFMSLASFASFSPSFLVGVKWNFSRRLAKLSPCAPRATAQPVSVCSLEHMPLATCHLTCGVCPMRNRDMQRCLFIFLLRVDMIAYKCNFVFCISYQHKHHHQHHHIHHLLLLPHLADRRACTCNTVALGRLPIARGKVAFSVFYCFWLLLLQTDLIRKWMHFWMSAPRQYSLFVIRYSFHSLGVECCCK